MKKITAKTILSPVKNDWFFGISYNMNIYRGCQHGCIYCDSRSSCYKIKDFGNIEFKQNASELLSKELASKKRRATIGFGSMNDPYMPIESETKQARKALGIIAQRKFPVHIITKSPLVCRDIDLLLEISKIYAAVTISFSTVDDSLAKKLEPNAPLPSERLSALKTLTERGVYCGIAFMPIIPFATDTQDNISSLVHLAAEANVSYILPGFGLTLREGSREYFYKKLKEFKPGLISKYERTFGMHYECISPNANLLQKCFYISCKKHGIKTKMNFYNPAINNQLSLF